MYSQSNCSSNVNQKISYKVLFIEKGIEIKQTVFDNKAYRKTKQQMTKIISRRNFF